jgi:hypothetical protein
MASDGSERGGLLTAGGVLSIIGGIFQIGGGIGSGIVAESFVLHRYTPLYFSLPSFLTGLVSDSWIYSGFFRNVHEFFPIWLFVAGGLLLPGILAIAGGISAVRRRRFGLSLAGAIFALMSGLLGVMAVIFVALGKREFRAKGG